MAELRAGVPVQGGRVRGSHAPQGPDRVGAIVNLYWDQLYPSPLNPRRHSDPETQRQLKASIERNGVEQNLVVRPAPSGRRVTNALLPMYEIIAGSRRRDAVEALVLEGRFATDVTIAVKIVECDDVELVERAMAENIQRDDLTPLEQADGCGWLAEHGVTTEAIADKLDKSVRWVNRRLAFCNRLAAPVRQAFADGLINLGQAEAFTVGEKAAQEQLLGSVTTHGQGYRAPDIRRILLERTIPLSRALFDPALYQGRFVKDLFEDETHASDLGEFRRLQIEACEAKKAELENTWSWVECQIGGGVAIWEFAKDQPPATGGTIIHLRDDLRVEIHTGLGRRAADNTARRGGGERVGAEKGPLTRAHLVWARQEKSRQLQSAVAASPAAAVSLAILQRLGAEEVRVRTGLTSGPGWGAAPPQDAIDHPALEARLTQLLAAAGLAPASLRLGDAGKFRALMGMSGVDRMALFAALVAPQCGTWPGADPDLGDSELTLAIADELALDATNFVLTPAYLERLSRAQLIRIALACGIAEEWSGILKKAELVDTILLAPGRDPAWFPPELRFATKAEILAELTPPARPGAAAAE